MAGSVAIIGGGGAGLVSAQALLAEGIEPVIFEARDSIGGNWRYDPEPGRSSCYASLTANTSRWRTTLKAHRLRPFGRTHLRHDEMLAYLEGFSERFGLGSRTRLGTEVAAVRSLEDGGGWELETAAGERSRHRAVVVATGYNSCPELPDWPGRLDGEIVHTHDYRTPDRFSGLDVVVVGMGCSATELACEVAEFARSVTLLTRSRRNVLPHNVAGVPVDLIDSSLVSLLPWSVRRRIVRVMERLTMGDLTRYGLPAPSGRPADKPIAISGGLRRALRSGKVVGRSGAIARLDGDRVLLEDGGELRADAILAGTGYRTEFPFLPSWADPPNVDSARLYRGIAPLDVADLFYVGIVFGHGALLPVFEAQARWVAAVLSGRLAVPSQEVMSASVEADALTRARDFDRNWQIAVDRQRYVRAVTREARTARPRGGPAAPILS